MLITFYMVPGKLKIKSPFITGFLKYKYIGILIYRLKDKTAAAVP